MIESHEEVPRLYPFHYPIGLQLVAFPQMTRPCIAEISTWRMGDQQVPINVVFGSVHRFENANRHLRQFCRIAEDVPLRMPAAGFLDVAGVGFMPFRPERLADGLGFLAGYQNFHASPSLPAGERKYDNQHFSHLMCPQCS